jgi:hypothetical protein
MASPSCSSIVSDGRYSCLSVEWRPGKLEERAMPLVACQPGDPARRQDPVAIHLRRRRRYLTTAEMVRDAGWNQEPCPRRRGPGCSLSDIPPLGSFRHSRRLAQSRCQLFDKSSGVGLHEARNDFGKPGYGGPCPPKGYGTHHYHFRLLAISRPTLDMKPTLTASDVLKTAELYAISAPSWSAPITAE